jgi:mono/diheme cytochrome c family protein
VECSQKLRIAPGNAQQSYLVDKIMGAAQDGGCFSGVRMPAGGPYLSDADIASIASWINAGAH